MNHIFLLFTGLIALLLFTASAMILYVPTTSTLIPDNLLFHEDGKADKTLSPYFFIRSGDPSLDQLPLKSTSADVNIAGVIADVSVTQEYANEGKMPVEAVYIFPASTRAAVYSMKMTIGERTIVSKICEREKARRDYEEAKNNGQSASLLEEQGPNVFQMNVANIMPGDKVKVELRYTEILVSEEGVYRFVYPTVVGPRYSNKQGAEVTQPEHWVSNPYTHQGEKPAYSFGISCGITAGMPISDIKCRAHKATISFESVTQVKLKLDPTETQGGNRDFILEYRLAGDKVESGLILYPGEKGNFFLAMIQPPKRVKLADIPAREYIFIMDVSGSMEGYPLNISKSLMRDLIGKLRPEDRFNLLLFAGDSRLFSEKSVSATTENLKSAIAFIDRENGGGGTELLSALKKALSLKGTENFARSFIIATDGYVDVEKEAFDLIRGSRDRANFFSFGIGTSVNRYLIEGMAHAGGGMPFVITEQSGSEAEAARFREYVQQPVLSHIKLSFPGFGVYDVEPLSVQDVFADRPVLVFGKYRGIPSGKVKVDGIAANGRYESILDVGNFKPLTSNSALRYLWARERIRNLDDFIEGGDENKEQVTKLGLEYNLLTRHTSFLAIDSEVRNHSGNSSRVEQPLPLPEGVSDYAISSSVQFTTPVIKSDCEVRESYHKDLEEPGSSELVFEEKSKNVFIMVEQMPEFPGGGEKLTKFLQDNLIYPELARENAIQGYVYLTFIVDSDGSIKDIKILRGIGGGCDEEAVRVIRLMPKWIPGRQNGKAVVVQFNLPVKFTLDK